MNVDGFKVIIRARNTFISARLELESQRAFAVIYDHGLNDAKEVVGEERMEIDFRFLQQITGSEYLYKKLVELPEPARSVPVLFNPGWSGNETANRLSL
jgi:hypothetical protein